MSSYITFESQFDRHEERSIPKTGNKTLIINVDPSNKESHESFKTLTIRDDPVKGTSIKLDSPGNVSNESTSIQFNSSSIETEEPEPDPEEDAHLPRVRVELDRLNYANESINNLEVELEEAKREFVKTLRDSEMELAKIEKKIGGHVLKAMPYYEDRMAMNLSKQKYLNAKFEFETAQELYVAAKNLQMYAEENLEDAKEANSMETDNLVKMLKMAKIKVSETEFAKQSCDLEQIEAFKIFDEHAKKNDQTEKKLKTSIVKSLKYFQMKSTFNKELKFFMLKIEGLKSCLREAKTTYQQSLKNLEKISTEVHEQRNTLHQNNSTNSLKSTCSNTSFIFPSAPAVTSYSSPNLRNLELTEQLAAKSQSLTTLTDSKPNATEDANKSDSEEQDYDAYFSENLLRNELGSLSVTKTVHYSQKLDKNAICLLSDEDIECLRLEKKLKKFENELLNRRKVEEPVVNVIETPESGDKKPKFQVPFLSKNMYF